MKKRHQSHAVRVKRTTSEKGAPIVQVPVYGAHEYAKNVNPLATSHATLDAADYDRIETEGWSLHWVLNASRKHNPVQSYVKVHQPGSGKRQVSHLILQPSRGSGISCRDGNPLNLRRSNLVIGRGRSKGDCTPPASEFVSSADRSLLSMEELEEVSELYAALGRVDPWRGR